MSIRTPSFQPPNPGANAKAILYEHDGSGFRVDMRLNVVAFTDVADALLVYEWTAPGSSTPRVVPPDWPGIAASTLFQRDLPLWPGKLRIYIQTVTAPTVWEVAAELVREDRALAQ